MITKQQILTQINEIVIAAQKHTSNMREVVGDDRANTVISNLLPFRNDDGVSYVISLGARIVDDEAQQTVVNILNFYTMVEKDSGLVIFYERKFLDELCKINFTVAFAAGFSL